MLLTVSCSAEPETKALMSPNAGWAVVGSAAAAGSGAGGLTAAAGAGAAAGVGAAAGGLTALELAGGMGDGVGLG